MILLLLGKKIAPVAQLRNAAEYWKQMAEDLCDEI